MFKPIDSDIYHLREELRSERFSQEKYASIKLTDKQCEHIHEQSSVMSCELVGVFENNLSILYNGYITKEPTIDVFVGEMSLKQLKALTQAFEQYCLAVSKIPS